MATITDYADSAKGIAYFDVDGDVSADDIITAARERPSFEMAKHLVDMTKASFHMLDISSLSAIVESFAGEDRVKAGGKTAVVVSSDIDQAIVTVFKELTEKEGHSRIAYKITSSRSEAEAWLSGADADG